MELLYFLLGFGLLALGALSFLMAVAVFRCPKETWKNAQNPSEILEAGMKRHKKPWE